LSSLLLSLLTSCATESSRNPRAQHKYYIPDKEVIYKTETTFAGREAEFVVTADAIYVMYGRNYAYLNPAYVCHYAIFPYDPDLEDDLIKIDCRGGGEGVRYFQFSDKTNAKIVYEKIVAASSSSLPKNIHDDSNKTGSDSPKRPRYFQVTEDIVFRTTTSFNGKDAEFVVSELGVYVLYGGDDRYMNPAYECLYKDFLQMSVEKPGSIGLTCKKDHFLYTLYYFQIHDSNDRAIAVHKISDQLPDKTDMVWNDAWRNKQLINAEKSFKLIGVTSSEACISDVMVRNGQQSDNVEFDPRIVLHPQIAPYVAADPSLLVLGLFAGVFVDIENLSQGWKAKRAEKKSREELKNKTVDPRKQTPQIGSSSELSLALAVTADSKLKNKVAYVAKLCDETEDEIGSYTSAYTGLSDSFSTIVEITEYSGELLKHDNPKHERLDTELKITAIYLVADTKSGNIITTGKVDYIDAEPVNVVNRNEITVAMIEDIMQVAYHDVAELIIDSILNHTSKH
jgi:hypothetical protein